MNKKVHSSADIMLALPNGLFHNSYNRFNSNHSAYFDIPIIDDRTLQINHIVPIFYTSVFIL